MTFSSIKRSPSGHRCGQYHQKAKLTTEQVAEMRHKRERYGWPYHKLAAHYGCGISTVRDIVTYRTRIAG